LVLNACNNIKNGNELLESDIQRIQKLGLLDKDETIIKFYSEYKNSVAGNFFTNKRMASYWIDENDSVNNQINTAFYSDIISIDTVINAGLTNSPYIHVLCKDSTKFKICFDGDKSQIRKAFVEAIENWKDVKQSKN